MKPLLCQRTEYSWYTFFPLIHPIPLACRLQGPARRLLWNLTTGYLRCCEIYGVSCLFLRSWAAWTLTTWTAPRSRWRSWTVTPSLRSRRRSSMPSSRMCPAPTGPKLLIWTWVCECTTGPERHRAGGREKGERGEGRGERRDNQAQPRLCLLCQVPPLPTQSTPWYLGRASAMVRGQKKLNKLMRTLLPYESSTALTLRT